MTSQDSPCEFTSCVQDVAHDDIPIRLIEAPVEACVHSRFNSRKSRPPEAVERLAERIRRALDLPADVTGLEAVLRLHPLLNPAGYVNAEISDGRLHVHRSPAHDDGAWIALCSPASPNPLQAIATGVDPRLTVHVEGTATDWTAEFEHTDTVHTDFPEVQVTKVSGGAAFQFQPRRSLPLTVV